jgi:hypothetical protein
MPVEKSFSRTGFRVFQLDALTENTAVKPMTSRSPRKQNTRFRNFQGLSGTFADFQISY